MTKSIYYVYPGQPYIGEAVIYLLLAFNNEPNNEDENAASVLEQEYSQIAIALTMIALESIVKVKLDEKDEIQPERIEELFILTLDNYTSEHGALELWTELKILRNQIIHSAYFEQSIKGGRISAETERRLESRYYRDFLDRDNECTKTWRLSINPLRVSRYEALVCFLFFYWYGKETGVWSSNLPLNTPYVDCRMEEIFKRDWIDIQKYEILTGHGGDKDFIDLIAFLFSRLPKNHRDRFKSLVQSTFDINMEEKLNFTNELLKMFQNERLELEEGSDRKKCLGRHIIEYLISIVRGIKNE